jgi:hypothetical protein
VVDLSHPPFFQIVKFTHAVFLIQQTPNWMTGRGEMLHTIQPIIEGCEDLFPDKPGYLKDSTKCTLEDMYNGEEFKDKIEIHYEYDHGDNWDHQINFLGRCDPMMRKAMFVPEDIETFCLSGEVRICILASTPPASRNYLVEMSNFPN